jgi:DHA1 family solute carrier family 18 vesicular amine transporter 1/2
MRRLPLVIYAIVFFDALLMFALVPLLPHYVNTLGLSKSQAGAVIGVYSAATLVFALPIGRVADRIGARRITVAGVALLAISTVAYAFADNFWVLFLARGGQGISSAVSWTAGLAWLSSATPASRRGSALGTAMTFGTVGAFLGPVMAGPLSGLMGVRPLFLALGGVAAGLTVWSLLPGETYAPPEHHAGLVETFRLALRSRQIAIAVLVMTLVAVVSGLLETLVPLRLGAAGYSASAISLVLGLGGIEAAATQMAVGRAYDRLGGLRIASVSVVAMAVLMVVIAVPSSALAVAVIYVIGTPAISGQYAVSFPLATAGADAVDLPHGIVLGAINVCWGLGFFVGPALGAAIAQASSDRVSYLLAAGVSALALPGLRILALHPTECQEPA